LGGLAKECLPGLDLGFVVFLRSAGVNTMMAALHGRCLEGKRLIDSRPGGCYQTLTLCVGDASGRCRGSPAAGRAGECRIDFAGYVEE
jgi:hypothetical protein